MRKLTKKNKRDIKAILRKKDKDIDFSDMLAVLDGAAPKSGSSTDRMERPLQRRRSRPNLRSVCEVMIQKI
jgi:hypothetical protein